jgi:hypothetical protein
VIREFPRKATKQQLPFRESQQIHVIDLPTLYLLYNYCEMPLIFGRSKSFSKKPAELGDSQAILPKSLPRRMRWRRKAVANVDRCSGTMENVIYSTKEQKSGFVFPSASTSTHSYIFKIVLLLMNHEVRRFELLQLEFDSRQALVADVLAQIPRSVTEVALRRQTYSGVVGIDGLERRPPQSLVSFCRGNDVVVAIPRGYTAAECMFSARPIVTDGNVVAMVRARWMMVRFLLVDDGGITHAL